MEHQHTTLKNKLLDKNEVAEIFGCKPETLDQWASDGRGVPFIKIGGLRRYQFEDIVRFIKENRTVTNG